MRGQIKFELRENIWYEIILKVLMVVSKISRFPSLFPAKIVCELDRNLLLSKLEFSSIDHACVNSLESRIYKALNACVCNQKVSNRTYTNTGFLLNCCTWSATEQNESKYTPSITSKYSHKLIP